MSFLFGILNATSLGASPEPRRASGPAIARGPAAWADDLTPIAPEDWNDRRAAIIGFLKDELKSDTLDFAKEDLIVALRRTVHLILSVPRNINWADRRRCASSRWSRRTAGVSPLVDTRWSRRTARWLIMVVQANGGRQPAG